MLVILFVANFVRRNESTKRKAHPIGLSAQLKKVNDAHCIIFHFNFIYLNIYCDAVPFSVLFFQATCFVILIVKIFTLVKALGALSFYRANL